MPKNKHAQALGKLGGKANTEAQRIARSINGKKGGRKKKSECIIVYGTHEQLSSLCPPKPKQKFYEVTENDFKPIKIK